MFWLISTILDWAEFEITCRYEYMNDDKNLQVVKYTEDWEKQEHKVLLEKRLKMPAMILCYTDDSVV